MTKYGTTVQRCEALEFSWKAPPLLLMRKLNVWRIMLLRTILYYYAQTGTSFVSEQAVT